MSDKITYRIEHDLYQDCIDRVARKIEAEGEKALALALKEHGFEKVTRCRDCKFADEDHYGAWGRTWHCERFGDAEPDGFCAWGERKDDD